MGQNTDKQAETQRLLKSYYDGFDLFRAGKFREAEPLMRSIMDFRPEQPEAQQNYAYALIRLGRGQDAVTVLEHVVELDPKLVSAWGCLGSAYASIGKLEEGINAYKKYVELCNKDSDLSVYLSTISHLEEQLKKQKENPETSKFDYYTDAILPNGKLNWPLGERPIRVYIEPGDGKKDYKPVFLELLKKAFNEWSFASQDKIRFKFVNKAPGAHICIRWTDSTKDLLFRSEGGHTKVEYAGPLIGLCEMTLLSESPWPNIEMSEKIAYRIYLHEVGHALGILGHSRNSSDIMFCGTTISV